MYDDLPQDDEDEEPSPIPVMKTIDIPLNSIEIGERRRSDAGDLSTLAFGLKRVGLLQPIIVDREKRSGPYKLIAGFRRLKAARLLRWKTIAASLLDTLTEEERRDIELEENENRKSLTAAERRKRFRASAQVAESAKKAREVLRRSAEKPDQKRTKGGRPTAPASERAVAEAVGVSVRTVERAEQHVELAGRFQWLQTDDWLQADVEKLRRLMNRLPDEAERDRLYQFMEETASPMLPRKDRIFEYAEIMPRKSQAQRDEIGTA